MSRDGESEEEEWAREVAEEEADRLRKEEPPPKLSATEFLAWRSPRAAPNNPTSMDNPLWMWLVRTRWDAYNANIRFSGPSSFERGPMWSFQRFGMSRTTMEDGRSIYIGGEHEDHYDPDFCIYNDVTIIHPTGEISLYGYPNEEFPPTDFHSATLVGNSIYVIGRLGSPEDRQAGVTPIYRLLLPSLKIEKVTYSGQCPGWLSHHSASLMPDGKTVLIEGGELWRGNDLSMRRSIDAWAFDTDGLEWRRVTDRRWQHFILRRTDRQRNRLWEVRQELWTQRFASHGFESYWQYSDQPDFEALAMLYKTGGQVSPPEEGVAVGEYRAVIDGLNVQFKEHAFCVEVVVEGQLSDARLAELQQGTLSLLERIDSSPYHVE